MSTDESISNSSTNPGTVLASTVDTEVMKYRTYQETITKLRTDYQILLGQLTENEMVLDEIQLLKKTTEDVEPPVIYKMIGPVLIQQSYDDAESTVDKRIEFIKNERDKLETKLKNMEQTIQEQATKIQQLQSALQETTVRAVQAISNQHSK